ncbi:MAG: hypothetical protein BGO78_11010 [Chloroflexi bacterium 44-23]|nr:MAG: hypothetical protein BGO78_11010 [Chloroflexi bacterium 44-23]
MLLSILQILRFENNQQILESMDRCQNWTAADTLIETNDNRTITDITRFSYTTEGRYVKMK